MLIKDATDIKLEGFWIIESSIKFNRELSLRNLRKKNHKIDKKNKIDLSYLIYRSGSTKFRIDCVIRSIGFIGNYFNFYIKTESHFNISRAKNDGDIDKKIIGSAIPMIISSVRNYLYSSSLLFPLNNYLMPLIDLKDYYIRLDKRKNKRSK